VLPTLDAHAHVDPARWPDPLPDAGAVLAMSLSPQEGAAREVREDAMMGWGIGCHPRDRKAQRAFDAAAFAELMKSRAIVGEVGLDGGGGAPPEVQRATFRSILALVADRPRIVSIHGYRADEAVLDELERTPVTAPILHWFQGSAAQASRAVRLGCYFSIHSAVARRSLFRTRVPLERVLLESDHGYDDPPAAIPLRIGWVEHLVAQQYGIEVTELRETVWRNFGTVVRATGTQSLLPAGIMAALPT
jgi:TatD DNase family protein